MRTLCVGLLDKNHQDKEQDDQQGAKPSVFFTIFTKSPLACLFFKPNDHEVKTVFKGLGASFLFVMTIYLGGNCLRRVPSLNI